MSNEPTSDLAKIARLNGDFRKNYGMLLGAFLYLRSINAARGGSFFWAGLVSIVSSMALTWAVKHGWAWLGGG